MRYEVLIRHARRTDHGEGAAYWYDRATVDAGSEEEAVGAVLRNVKDRLGGICEIVEAGRRFATPFSLDTGHPEFPSDSEMPALAPRATEESGLEQRCG